MVALARVTDAHGAAPAAEDGARPQSEQAFLDLLAPVLAEFAKHRPDSPEEDAELIVRAGRTALAAHEGQFRRSGEPYITHPVAVATIVAELGLDAQTVAAALLHDAVEDTGLTLDSIRTTFGDGVARVVDGVTKLTGSSSTPRKPSRRRPSARCSSPWPTTGGSCSSSWPTASTTCARSP